jgi:NADH:ubiquinone reductase (H+-translocating)
MQNYNGSQLPDNLLISIPDNGKPRVVIIGGGFGGIELAKRLKGKGLQIVMFDRNNYHTFQPLLYQVATAGLEPDSIAGPLRKLFDDHDDDEFFFRLGTVDHINPETNNIETSIGHLHYDYLVIANGSRTNFFNNKELFDKAFPLKQVPHALDLRSHILQNFEKAVLISDEQEKKGLMTFVIVGGGPTGVELSGAFGELRTHVLPKDYPELDFNKMKIYLVEGSPKLLGTMSEQSSRKALDYVRNFGVDVLLNTVVTDYNGDVVTLSTGEKMHAQTVIWAAGVLGNLIKGLNPDIVTRNSRIKVDNFNRVEGYSNIFAIGDIAAMSVEEYPNGHPMVAPVAIQQGKLLGKNLVNFIKGKEMTPFKYKDKGSMATIGRNRAVVDLPNGIRFQGLFAWFVWMFVHLMSIVGFRAKAVVLANWIWNYFTYDRGTRLIIRPYVKHSDRNKTPEREAVK